MDVSRLYFLILVYETLKKNYYPSISQTVNGSPINRNIMICYVFVENDTLIGVFYQTFFLSVTKMSIPYVFVLSVHER